MRNRVARATFAAVATLASPSIGLAEQLVSAEAPSDEPAKIAALIEQVYPPRARNLNMPGKATINCMVNHAGALEDCHVVSESPTNFGFGQAAIQLSKSFHMKPKTANGRAVTGARVTVPIAFQLGEATLSSVTPPKPMAAATSNTIDAGWSAYNRGDYKTAIVVWRDLAEHGNSMAQEDLGMMYHEGIGVPRDLLEAARWYRLSAESGYAPAQGDLGSLYQKGEGVAQDYIEAVKWYKKAISKGDVHAESSLAAMYLRGEGVPTDYAEGVRLAKLAAENGEPVAEANLAFAYQSGRGVPRNPDAAFDWYKKAAAQGNVSGLMGLGVAYMNGYGAQKNDSIAVIYFRKAADAGFPDAQVNLGVMYALGRGVSKDTFEAYKWFVLALSLTHGVDVDKDAIQFKKLSGASLNPTQKVEADRWAAAWKPKKIDLVNQESTTK